MIKVLLMTLRLNVDHHVPTADLSAFLSILTELPDTWADSADVGRGLS